MNKMFIICLLTISFQTNMLLSSACFDMSQITKALNHARNSIYLCIRHANQTFDRAAHEFFDIEKEKPTIKPLSQKAQRAFHKGILKWRSKKDHFDFCEEDQKRR